MADLGIPRSTPGWLLWRFKGYPGSVPRVVCGCTKDIQGSDAIFQLYQGSAIFGSI